jgi:outer membrane protein assembly factor BamD (BamD/ComL family)
MTHQCDDTAYPAAAMPGECTCDVPSEEDLERLVDEARTPEQAREALAAIRRFLRRHPDADWVRDWGHMATMLATTAGVEEDEER